jgi:hypothetical protein
MTEQLPDGAMTREADALSGLADLPTNSKRSGKMKLFLRLRERRYALHILS